MNATLTTPTPRQLQAHAEAERVWHLNFSYRETEEFEGLLGIVEREQRRERLRAKLLPHYDFLRYHLSTLRDQWSSLASLYGDDNSGTRCNEYDTLAWLGVAERKIEPLVLFDKVRGYRIFFRLAQDAADTGGNP